MLYKIDFSTQLSRTLYADIHARLAKFCSMVHESEDAVRMKLVALVNGDPSLHLLIDLNDNGIIEAHCLLNLQILPDQTRQIFVDQLHVDSGHDTGFIQQCEQYATEVLHCHKLLMFCAENRMRAYKKKYHFHVFKVLMHKELPHTEANE